MWFRGGLGSAGSMVGLNDLGEFFQPKGFHNSVPCPIIMASLNHH